MNKQIETVKPHAEASAVIQSELIKALGGTPTHMLIDEPQTLTSNEITGRDK